MIEMTRPGMGDRTMPSDWLTEEPVRLGGGAALWPGMGRLLRLLGGGVGSASTSTWKDSPSTVTSTGEEDRSPISTVYHCWPTLIRKVAIANLLWPGTLN